MYGLPDATGDPSGPKTVDRWFTTDALTAVASGVFGNEIRNQLRGPGFQSFDLALQRLVRFGSRYTVSFRWDAFNLFNTTNFGLPNKDIASRSTFGTISSLSGDPRTMQLSVRFLFLATNSTRSAERRAGSDASDVPSCIAGGLGTSPVTDPRHSEVAG
jgi:hypothetical protein